MPTRMGHHRVPILIPGQETVRTLSFAIIIPLLDGQVNGIPAEIDATAKRAVLLLPSLIELSKCAHVCNVRTVVSPREELVRESLKWRAVCGKLEGKWGKPPPRRQFA